MYAFRLFRLISILACSVVTVTGATNAPIRVVSLAPSLTEIICAVGGESNLVGRTSYCNFPTSVVDRIPVVGGFGMPSMEALLTLHPDLILDVDLDDKSMVKQLHDVGLEHCRISCHKLDDIPSAIEEVGTILNQTESAHLLASQLSAGLAELRRQTSTHTRPRVFIQIWSDPIIAATPHSFISELVELAGGENICTNATTDFMNISSEWVVGENPQVILCLDGDGTKDSRHLVMERPGWGSIDAVKSGRVYDRFNMDILTRPGPRVLQGIKALRACILPPEVAP